jgi:hypothetical protein
MLFVWVLFRMAGIGLLGSIGLPIYAWFHWRGWWRLAAVVPLSALAVLIVPLAPAWMRDPSAHNLWGLILIPLEAVMCLYMAALVLFRWRHSKKVQ